ncbi:MAG: hypothetical protein AMS27_09110 [Bacteroides sp. SM23_62_1]|nr:MAG: hypothetical protein AMS27_09110 [Bacteroides sp. SM23_62_1]
MKDGLKNNFFLITQVFYPDEVSTANLFTNLCSYLVEDNVEVEVWCAQPSYTHFKRQPKKLVYNGIKIHYLPSTNFPKSRLSGRLTNYLTFSISVICKLIFNRDKIPVFTHTTPPSLGIIISFICSLKKRKFVYILLDIFPDGLIRLGNVSKRNLFIRLWKKMNISALKKSEKLIVIGRDMKQWLSSVYPTGLSKTEIIPLWQDDRLINPVQFETNIFIQEHQLQGKFVVQYSGNMGMWNEMKTLGKAISMNTENVFFIFVGGGRRKNELLENFSIDQQKNFLLLPFQSNEKLCDILTACHTSLVSLKEGLEGIAVPSKIYGIMAAGVPVIALVPEQCEIAYIVKEENCGYVVPPNDVNGLIDAILKLKSDEQLRKKMGYNGRRAFEEKYTTRIIAREYKLLIQTLDKK